MIQTVFDWETRSPVDINKQGAFVYAEHPDTEIMCLSVAVDMNPPLLWVPEKFRRLISPKNIRYKLITAEQAHDLILRSDQAISHNASFEYVIWRKIAYERLGWPELPLDKLHCTLAMCAYHALPLNLDQAAQALNLAVKKDMKGNSIMLKLCRPRKPRQAERDADPYWATKHFWHEDPADLEALFNYGGKDAEVERQVFHSLAPLPPFERKIWLLDQRINLRGVPVDIENVRAIVEVTGDRETEQLAKFQKLTNGQVSGPRSYVALKDWVNEQTGLQLVTVDKTTVTDLLKGTLPANKEKIVHCKQKPFDVYIGRGSKWGNQFEIGKHGDRAEVIQKYETYIRKKPELLSALFELSGKVLGCYCSPKACHGEVFIKLIVEEVLKIKAELSKSSVAKFKSMLARVNSDGRLRGMFQYGGASTMRWAARGVQLHNQPRDSYGPETWENVAELFRDHDTEAITMLYDDPFFVASRCVRGALCTKEGRRFICADFNSIEARGNAFLAGEKSTLDAFIAGKDPYKVAAQGIFNVEYDDVTKDQRQVGKVSELALGYNGGIGAYASMASGYGVDLETLSPHIMPYATEEELEGPYGARALAKSYLTQNPGAMSMWAAVACDVIKRKWRAAHPNIVRFWHGLQEAAYQAIESPGEVRGYRGIRYCMHDRFLKCLLPSGRLMQYYLPRISPVETLWKEKKLTITYMGMKVVDGATTRQWTRLATYGGKICENVVQAYCRDLLAEAMLRLEKAGYPQVLHVHDECAAEMPDGSGTLEEYLRIMSEVPTWAAGMPITADGWVGRRYRK